VLSLKSATSNVLRRINTVLVAPACGRGCAGKIRSTFSRLARGRQRRCSVASSSASSYSYARDGHSHPAWRQISRRVPAGMSPGLVGDNNQAPKQAFRPVPRAAPLLLLSLGCRSPR
jgi:hypothetical protein